MNNGFVFGENASSFDYDHRFNQIMDMIGELVNLQRMTLEELRDIKHTLQEGHNIGPIEEVRMDL